MSDRDDDKEQRLGLWIAGGAAGLAVLATLFYGIWGWENGHIEGSPTYGQASAASAATVAASAASGEAVVNPAEVILAPAAASAADEASVVVENGVVKFYFASGKADLAIGAQEALKDVLAGTQNGKKAVVSGFHDSTGNVQQNEELSKQRAFAVRDALLALGVPESQIELRKPASSDGGGSGSNAEARRVEVVLE